MPTLNLRDSARRRDEITRIRLDRVVPELMAAEGVECWILVSREYAEDPVAQSMLPATWMSSRRRTVLVFTAKQGSHDRFAVTRYEVDGLFPAAWNPQAVPDQWQAVTEKIAALDPETIAISTSSSFAHADGLTHSEHRELTDALGPHLSERVVSGESLSVGWLQTRISEELPIMEEACRTAHEILRRALSPEAIRPGATTTTDLEWWLRDEVQLLGCPVWFHPTVSVQRHGADLRGSFASAARETLISPGDLVHIDFGIVWDHLCTDQQQHGYVLKPGESHVPDGLSVAMTRANQVQDILTAHFVTGRTGNEVLDLARRDAVSAGLNPTIYTHPIGYHGHGAGPTIGLWDQQGGVDGPGDLELFEPSAWSIELMNRTQVPEWGNQEVGVMLEEDAWFANGNVEFLDGRQTEIWEI